LTEAIENGRLPTNTDTEQYASSTELRVAVQEVRDHFEGRLIRRTIHSVGRDGKPILSLEDPLIVEGKVELREAELDKVAALGEIDRKEMKLKFFVDYRVCYVQLVV
jgi:hypothetical protein